VQPIVNQQVNNVMTALDKQVAETSSSPSAETIHFSRAAELQHGPFDLLQPSEEAYEEDAHASLRRVAGRRLFRIIGARRRHHEGGFKDTTVRSRRRLSDVEEHGHRRPQTVDNTSCKLSLEPGQARARSLPSVQVQVDRTSANSGTLGRAGTRSVSMTNTRTSVILGVR
jgi:hypothetical protein